MISSTRFQRFLTGAFLLLLACADRSSRVRDDVILASVADRTLTVREFRARVELTPHPSLPGKSDEQVKNTLLNNLLLEKIFAMEAGDENGLAKLESFKHHMRGIREQSMREQLFYHVAYDRVQLNPDEIREIYSLAARQYELEFYSIHRNEIADSVSRWIEAQPDSITAIFNSLGNPAKVPKKTVKFKDPDHQLIHEALFTKPLPADTVIGPLRLGENNHLIFRVKDWVTVPVIGPEAAQLRWKEVSEKVHWNRANRLWADYVRELMAGVKIEFQPETFTELADIFLSMEQAQSPEEKIEISKRLQEPGNSDRVFAQLDERTALLDRPFFTIGDQVWSVRDFKNAVMSHPLVYRKSQIDAADFPRQFKYAVADLIRDIYLTERAYGEGLDNRPEVERRVRMWRDAFIAISHRNAALKTLAEKHGVQGEPVRLGALFDDYILDMSEKYRAEIEINREELKSVRLTGVSMFAVQPDVPYPVAVPGFPLMSTESTLLDSLGR